ncbi:hypothetical protein ACU4GA_11210 [Methylobacterium oryzae CBMB20]
MASDRRSLLVSAEISRVVRASLAAGDQLQPSLWTVLELPMPSSLWTVLEPQSTLPVVTSRRSTVVVAVVDDGGPVAADDRGVLGARRAAQGREQGTRENDGPHW